jgi:hypothetical protein
MPTARSAIGEKEAVLQGRRHVKVTTGGFSARDGPVLLIGMAAVTMSQFYPPDGAIAWFPPAGCKVVAGPSLRSGGPMLMGTKNHLVSYFGSADGPRS